MKRASLAMLLLCFALRAQAQDDALARGLASSETGDHAAALAAFTDAWDRTAAPIARAHMAIEALALDRFALAETYASEALAFTGDTDVAAMSAELASVRDAAASHLGNLEVRCTAACLISVDGSVVGTTPLPHLLRVALGAHAVHAELPGAHPADASVEVSASGVARVTLAPEHIDTRPILERDGNGEGARIAGGSVLAAGGVALVIASVALGIELDRDSVLRSDACTPATAMDTRESTCPDAASTRGTYTDVARVMFVSAAVLAAAGLILILTAPSAPASPSVACVPALGIVCQARF